MAQVEAEALWVVLLCVTKGAKWSVCDQDVSIDVAIISFFFNNVELDKTSPPGRMYAKKEQPCGETYYPDV